MSNWGKAHENNTIGFGQGSANNSIGWGSVYDKSFSGETILNPSLNPFENAISYYKFDETSGQAIDFINSFNGTLFGGVTQGVPGKIEKGYLFDSNLDFVKINKQLLPSDNSDFAFNFYIKGIQGSNGGIISAFGGFNDNLRAGWRFNGSKFSFWNNGEFIYDSVADIDDNEFHTISVSRESGIVSVFIDGVLDGTYNYTKGFQQDVNTVIGSFEGAGASLSQTTLDEFSFYKSSLSLKQVNALHNNGNGTTLNVFTEQKDLIVEMGQSNMQGRFGDEGNPNYPFESNNGYWFNGNLQNNITTLRGDAIKGSHANYFCEKYFALTGRKAVMIECASGGSGLTAINSSNSNNWSATGALRNQVINKVSSALPFYSKTSPKAGLWCQGERDAQEIDDNVNYTKADVKYAMQDLINWWQTSYPGTPFFISELGDFSDGRNNQGWQDVRAVQNEIVSENTNVFMAFTGAKNFPTQGFMGDSLHYSFEGNKLMGEAFAESIDNNI